MKTRNEINKKYKWDLTEYFKNDEEWEKLLQKTQKNYKKLLNFENKLYTKEEIYNCLTQENELSKDVELLFVYAELKLKEDSTNAVAQDRMNRLQKLSVQMDSELTFISVELKELSDTFLNELAQDECSRI